MKRTIVVAAVALALMPIVIRQRKRHNDELTLLEAKLLIQEMEGMQATDRPVTSQAASIPEVRQLHRKLNHLVCLGSGKQQKDAAQLLRDLYSYIPPTSFAA